MVESNNSDFASAAGDNDSHHGVRNFDGDNDESQA